MRAIAYDLTIENQTIIWLCVFRVLYFALLATFTILSLQYHFFAALFTSTADAAAAP